ncbi:MAG: hypothetical protein ACREK6_20150 [Candidatus Rokuibacteriota bacterium]
MRAVLAVPALALLLLLAVPWCAVEATSAGAPPPATAPAAGGSSGAAVTTQIASLLNQVKAEDYERALAPWTADLDPLARAVVSRKQALDATLKRLAAHEGQMSAAQRKDAEAARRAAQDARAAAEKALAPAKAPPVGRDKAPGQPRPAGQRLPTN